MNKYDSIVSGSLDIAQTLLIENRNTQLSQWHLVYGLIKNPSSYSSRVLKSKLSDVKAFISNLACASGEVSLESVRPTPELSKWLTLASSNSIQSGRQEITETDLLRNIVTIIPELNIDPSIFAQGSEDEEEVPTFLTNLNEMAEAGKLDPVIGRSKEIRAVMEILGRRGKNNPILVGPAGVGKTAIVEGLAEMIVKVKEPIASEYGLIRPNQLVFTYFHFASSEPLTHAMIKSNSICIAYETVTSSTGGLPLLAPMSEVAGRMSIQAGAHALEKAQGGLGALLGGVPGVAPAKVLVVGGGVVGTQAARMAVGMGADVTILDRSLPRLRQLDTEFDGRLKTVYSTADAMDQLIVEADLVIGAVLIPGAAAPKLVTKEHIKMMKKGAVIVDVAIDQGGCFETSKATTHQEPTFVVDGVVHYCVANMPGGVARTSTMALTNATLPYAVNLANKGAIAALRDDVHLRNGLNVHAGMVTHKAVSDALGCEFIDPCTALDRTELEQTA